MPLVWSFLRHWREFLLLLEEEDPSVAAISTHIQHLSSLDRETRSFALSTKKKRRLCYNEVTLIDVRRFLLLLFFSRIKWQYHYDRWLEKTSETDVWKISNLSGFSSTYVYPTASLIRFCHIPMLKLWNLIYAIENFDVDDNWQLKFVADEESYP